MDGRRLKFVLLGAGVLGSMLFLLLVGMKSGGMVYYVTVEEFLRQGDRGTDVRINGKVQSGTIDRLPTGQDVRFTIIENGASLPVVYHGVIPDTFVDEAAVVVEGRLQGDGTFRAHTLLAKCPSKYESAEGAPAVPQPAGV